MELTTSAAVPVDMARIREAADGDDDFLRQLVEVFLEDADEKVHEIEAAIANGDPRGLGRTAHQLKGSSANVGANGLRTFALELEAIGRADKLDGASELCRKLAIELARVRAHLLSLLS